MKKIFLILLLTTCLIQIVCPFGVYSQQSITWQRTYGNHLADPETFGVDICPGDSGNFYVVGYNHYPESFNVIKINAYGDTLWERTVDSVNNNYAGCTASGDGGVVCSGDESFTVKFDKYGNRIWRKHYEYGDQIHKIIRTSDGNFVACGQYGGWQGLIFKTDSNGNLIWLKDYNLNYWSGWYNYIIESNDNKYIAVGFRRYTGEDTVRGLITKLDTAGNIIWEKEYILYNFTTNFISVDKTNNGYLLISQTIGPGGWGGVICFSKLNETGNLQYFYRFNADSLWGYIPMDIKKVNNNKYLLCAYGINLTHDTMDSRILTTDSLGNIYHEKIFRETDYIKVSRALVVGNNDIMLVGSSDHVNFNYSDTWVIRTDSNLNAPPIGIKLLSNYIPQKFVLTQNYPNPFNPTTKIKFSIPLLRGVPEGEFTTPGRGGVLTKLIVYDLLGREVATLVNESLQPGTYEVNWNTTNFASGIYFYKFETESFSQTKKMVLIK